MPDYYYFSYWSYHFPTKEERRKSKIYFNENPDELFADSYFDYGDGY